MTNLRKFLTVAVLVSTFALSTAVVAEPYSTEEDSTETTPSAPFTYNQQITVGDEVFNMEVAENKPGFGNDTYTESQGSYFFIHEKALPSSPFLDSQLG